MPIRIHGEDLEEIQWLVRRDYEGEMGRRSTMGGILDVLERDALVQMPGKSGDISDGAVRAAARLRLALARFARCSGMQQAMLSSAFGDGDPEDFKPYGEFPRAVLACPEALALRNALGDHRPLAVFLRSLASTAKKGRGKHQKVAVAHINRLRGATEERLVSALLAYGARVEGVSVPQSVSVNQIAQATGLAHDTVKARLAEKGALPERRALQPRAAFRIPVRTLQTKWPEAANEIINQSVALREVDSTAA